MTRRGALGSVLALAVLIALGAAGALLLSERRVLDGAIAAASGGAVPDLDNPGMIRRGAVHYDLVCADCHGSPTGARRGAHLHLSPPAPVLHQRVEAWPPRLAFRVIRDGVPNSAMPAWPAADRDDEVWAVVAFLQVLPDLTGEGYINLVGSSLRATEGAPSVADALQHTCRRCHGFTDVAPRLEIQDARYLTDMMEAYRSGARESGFMSHLASRLRDGDIEQLATWLAGVDGEVVDTAAISPAPTIVSSGAPERQIAACSGCHGTTTPIRPEFPGLAGQDRDYLVTQLTMFADDAPHDRMPRGGGPFISLMDHAARGLTEEEITAIASYYAGLDAEERSP